MIFKLNELILNSKDYEFSKFSHKGFGGTNKYIATPKTSGLPKLLIKHKGEFSPPCNSFIYGRIAQLLDVTAPKTYLIDTQKSDEHLFESDCVVGIEFIEELLPLNIQEIKNNPKLYKDYVDCFTLYGLLTTFDDSMQCAYVPKEGVYPLDFDESFSLDNALFNIIKQNNFFSEDTVRRRLEYCKDINLNLNLKICAQTAAEALEIPIDDVVRVMRNTLLLFRNLQEEEIVSVTDALIEKYPPLLAVYYEDYIKILQQKIVF